MSTKTLGLLTLALLLQGCFFFYIPGSVTSAISDSLTGAEGSNCVGATAKVGDTIRLPGGGRGTVKSLSGTSTRCTNPDYPVRALLVFDEIPSAASPALKTWTVALKLPEGYEKRPLLEGMTRDGIVHALNRTTDTGVLLSAAQREGITDMMAFTIARRDAQVSRLTEALMSQVSQLQINGRTAYRYEVTGKVRSGMKISYITTVIGGAKEIAVLNTWTAAANFELQKESMERLAQNVEGL